MDAHACLQAGGLKFASKRVTLGYTKADAPKVPLEIPKEWVGRVPFQADLQVPKPGELILVRNIKVSPEPSDDLYVPTVQ